MQSGAEAPRPHPHPARSNSTTRKRDAKLLPPPPPSTARGSALSSELCAATRPRPLIAVLICGNFRTFGDPRVYKSIRHNLVEALGGDIVVFVWGRMDSAHKAFEPLAKVKHTARGEPAMYTYAQHLERIRTAAAYIAKGSGTGGGQDVEVHLQLANSTDTAGLVNERCTWLDALKYSSNQAHRPLVGQLGATPSSAVARDRWLSSWRATRLQYVGQMSTHHEVFRMMEGYERLRGVRFDRVAKARPDGVWLRAVAPYCAYLPAAVYSVSKQPADWFFLGPRDVVADAMRGVWERYRVCVGESFTPYVAACCGGGPTGAIMGAFARSNAAIIGPTYPVKMAGGAPRKKPPSPGSREAGHLFDVLVMRDVTDNAWCKDFFLYSGELQMLPSEQICREMLEPEEIRNRGRIDAGRLPKPDDPVAPAAPASKAPARPGRAPAPAAARPTRARGPGPPAGLAAYVPQGVLPVAAITALGLILLGLCCALLCYGGWWCCCGDEAYDEVHGDEKGDSDGDSGLELARFARMRSLTRRRDADRRGSTSGRYAPTRV